MRVSRRAFLQTAAGAAGALAGAPAKTGGEAGGTNGVARNAIGRVESVLLRRAALPVLRTAEVAMVGGSFGGVAAALQFARAGRTVVLIEPRTYLGGHVTATLRPWVTCKGEMPEVVRACLPNATDGAAAQEVALKPDTVKLALEDLLLGAGVELLYASYPVGLAGEVDNLSYEPESGRERTAGQVANLSHLNGLIIGNKSGRQIIACKLIVDASETATVMHLAGAEFDPPPLPAGLFRRTLEFEGVAPLSGVKLQVPAELGFADNEVALHPGCRGKGHVLVECEMVLSRYPLGTEGAMRREIEARKRTMALAAHLIGREPAFQSAFLAATSYELFEPSAARVKRTSPEWALNLNAALSPFGDASTISLAAFAGPVRGLFRLAEPPGMAAANRTLVDPVRDSQLGAAFAGAVQAQWDSAVFGPGPAAPNDPIRRLPSRDELDVKEPESPRPGRPYARQAVQPMAVPIVRNVDVLVVGGGTSGATAAAVAAREGMKTLLLEMNPGLGGTGTIAAVDSYWFGRRVGFAARVTERVKEVHESIHYQPASGGKWNLEAKMYALLREAEDAGAEVLFNTIALGTIVEKGNVVRGVVAATRYRPVAVLAKVVIDATGDGDVAVCAGAESVLCSAMDRIGMWHTLAQFGAPGRNNNSFTSSVVVNDVEDCTRAILAGRRRGRNCHDHGVYLAARETRHVLGDVVVTLTDQLRGRAWRDVVNIHYSNHDVKGKTCSPWLLSGLIPPNLETEIPYRALLPKGVENVLVAGKAFSTTHDGLAGTRMQADLENLGGVVALAAAMAVREGKSPRRIDVGQLQARLVKEGVLPAELLSRKLMPRRYSNRARKALVAAMIADRPLLAYQNMKMGEMFRGTIPFVEVCTAGPRVVPQLEAALKTAPADRAIVVAQALAMVGSQAGVPVLIRRIEELLAGDRVPARDSKILYFQLPPDQGAMPDVCYLLYNLGMARDRRALEVWRRIADILNPTEADFRDSLKSPFHYVDAVCYGAERLGDPAAIPILEKLLSYPALRGLVARKGFQPDFVIERRAMCELSLARALARCGGAKGFELLIAYLDDNRALLAEQAHANLFRITGRDHGKDSRAWTAWLDGARGSLKPRPLAEDLDAVFERDILTA